MCNKRDNDTSSFDLTNHRKLWEFLEHNPTKSKEDWPDWNGKFAVNTCFACDYLVKQDLTCCGGDTCPLIWDGRGCQSSISVYNKWRTSDDPIEKSYYAKIIKELKVKEGVKTK